MQGNDAQFYYATQRGKFRPGELVRMDVTNHHRGYWSNAGRMAVIGEPSTEQATAYNNNLTLKAAAKEALRSAKRCREVFEAVQTTSQQKRIKFWEDVGVGHGVGTSDREPPYLKLVSIHKNRLL